MMLPRLAVCCSFVLGLTLATTAFSDDGKPQGDEKLRIIQKIDALSALESQAFEGGALGDAETMASAPPASRPKLRRAWLRARWEGRAGSEAKRFRQALNHRYGAERGEKVKFAEAFEICEYGRQPTDAEVRKLFPFFDGRK